MTWPPAWGSGTSVGELGEFGLLDRLRALLPGGAEAPGVAASASGGAGALILPPGDDAALLRPPADRDLVLTCDIQIAGRHFEPRWISPREAGGRAAEVNLSDLAAMGAEPLAALVSLGLPGELPVAAVEELYRGMIERLSAAGAQIAGGNLTAAESLLIDMTLIGTVVRESALTRAGAAAGELVFVTGQPGRAAAACELLREVDAGRWTALAARLGDGAEALRERLREAYAAPRARLAVGRFLRENELARAAIDQSDGLGGDLGHLAEGSEVGIRLRQEALPVSEDLGRLGAALSRDPLAWVLGPSDDYELLFTVASEKADLVFALAGRLGLAIHPIGEVTPGPPRVILKRVDGQEEPVPAGWDHFAGEEAAGEKGPR